MRDHGKISPTFWTGTTGRALRGDAEAQIVAMYLLTSPHATMVGVFICPVIYIAHETGLPSQGVERALTRLEEVGFCLVDRVRDLVWVREMARFQVGETLSSGDKRVKNVASLFAKIPAGQIKDGFFARYGADFHLISNGLLKDLPQTQKAPSKDLPEPEKPLPSKEKEKEKEKEKDLSVLTDGPIASEAIADPTPPQIVPSDVPITGPPELRLVHDLATSAAPGCDPAGPPDPSVAERELFARGKVVLGATAGGQVTKLLARKAGNVSLARAAIEVASTKHNPREYVARIIRGDDTGMPPGQLYDRGL